jgi:hypothetical protein
MGIKYLKKHVVISLFSLALFLATALFLACEVENQEDLSRSAMSGPTCPKITYASTDDDTEPTGCGGANEVPCCQYRIGTFNEEHKSVSKKTDDGCRDNGVVSDPTARYNTKQCRPTWFCNGNDMNLNSDNTRCIQDTECGRTVGAACCNGSCKRGLGLMCSAGSCAACGKEEQPCCGEGSHLFGDGGIMQCDESLYLSCQNNQTTCKPCGRKRDDDRCPSENYPCSGNLTPEEGIFIINTPKCK